MIKVVGLRRRTEWQKSSSQNCDEWDEIMLGSDVCYAPVLDLIEAPSHPHTARGSFC